MDFQPQFFGSLTELITVIVALVGGFWWLKKSMEETNQRLSAMRQWQDAALDKVLSGQDNIVTACERVMEQLIKSNEKVLSAMESTRDRHGDEHREILERILKIALERR